MLKNLIAINSNGIPGADRTVALGMFSPEHLSFDFQDAALGIRNPKLASHGADVVRSRNHLSC